MKKLLLALLIITGFSYAQEFNLKWSEKFKFDHKELYMDYLLGTNSKYMYAKYFLGFNKKIKLVAFDKLSLKKVFEVPIKGLPQNEADKKVLDDLSYHKTVIFENTVYVFWLKEDKKKDEMYVQTFTSNLKPQSKLKKIYEIASAKGDKKKAELFIMANEYAGEKIIIGGEQSGEKGEKVKIEFRVLNKDLTTSNAMQAELPLVIEGRSNNLSSEYKFENDGNLYVKFKNSLTVVNTTNGQKNTFNFEYKDKKIFDINYTVTNEFIKIYGMYSDLQKDKRGNDIHGIYTSFIENGSYKVKENNFNAFTKDMLDKIFAKDTEDRKDKTGLLSSKKKKDSEDKSLGSSYTIEYIYEEGENTTIFCSKLYNYTVTTTTRNSDGSTTTTTRYYCQKDNVTAFKFDKKGAITWASNIDRRITYDGWDVYDLNVIKKDNTFYVIYGSSFEVGAKKKGCFSGKSSADLRDKFEYATFDDKTGNSVRKEMLVNAKNTPKKDIKVVSPTSIEVHDNVFYTKVVSIRLKWGYYFLGPCTCLAAYIPAMKTGDGYIGLISPK